MRPEVITCFENIEQAEKHLSELPSEENLTYTNLILETFNLKDLWIVEQLAKYYKGITIRIKGRFKDKLMTDSLIFNSLHDTFLRNSIKKMLINMPEYKVELIKSDF